jgi:alpha-tubulin suppressor-like RCC1 family protein
LTKVDFFKDQNVGQVDAGQFHSLALTANGDVMYAWGRSDSGQLGIGGDQAVTDAGASYKVPQRVPIATGTICKKLATGETTSMVLTSKGELYSWGFEGYGHPGEGDVVLPRRVKVAFDVKVLHMDGGGQFGVLVVDKRTK